MISEYDMRDKFDAMTDEERAALPRIVNNNGRDYASCPECKHYHAMMPTGLGFNYCRDCGALGVVVAEPANPVTNKITHEEIKHLIVRRGLSVTDVLDVVCELNGFVGVGYITFGEQMKEYIQDKAKSGLSAEAWMNS